jgi:predicted phage terminase large subunit-like protein
MTNTALMDLPSLDEIKAELARRQLIRFIKHTKPDYDAGWFHIRLGAKLDQFLQDVVDKKSPRMIIMAPPRHGKTEEVSRRFPAYALGKYPNMRFIATSYNSDLASSINRDVQRIISSEEYFRLFPETTISGSDHAKKSSVPVKANSEEFDVISYDGFYKSAGVGGGISGRGGDVLLIDDPIKDDEEAHSQTVRDKIWNWYTSTLYTRCEPGAGILLIMTRWHEDDLAGRLIAAMKEGGEQWEIVRFPAIAEEDEFDEAGELLRKKGEALHPARYPVERLDKIKIGTADKAGVGSRVWASLYQQRPSAAEGNLFKRENWVFLKPPRDLEALSHKERREYFAQLGIRLVIQAWDTALGGKKKNDNTACVTLGIAPSRYYVIDVWKDKLQFPDVLNQVELLYDKWLPNQVIVEGGGSASGKATVQTLTRSTRIPFKEHSTVTDKVFRADTISPTHESKLVTIFQGGKWVAGFVDQCAGFPNITNDDDVDAWMLAMEKAIGKTSGLHISDELLAKIGR